MSEYLNFGCGRFRAPAPWLNLDIVSNDEIRPDRVIAPWPPVPFASWSARRIYAGHVLEHLPWSAVHVVLMDLRRVLTLGGELLVVGPDVRRILERWKANESDWAAVQEAIEWHTDFQREAAERPGTRHEWNCAESRVVDALRAAGFVSVTPLPVTEDALAGWPVVSHFPSQCAILAVK